MVLFTRGFCPEGGVILREWPPEIFRQSASDASGRLVESADANAGLQNGGVGCEHRGEGGEDMLTGFKGGGGVLFVLCITCMFICWNKLVAFVLPARSGSNVLWVMYNDVQCRICGCQFQCAPSITDPAMCLVL